MTKFRFDLAEWFSDNADRVHSDLVGYFGGGEQPFTGRWFEEFSAISDPDRFEAVDLLAVKSLSVTCPPSLQRRCSLRKGSGSTRF